MAGPPIGMISNQLVHMRRDDYCEAGASVIWAHVFARSRATPPNLFSAWLVTAELLAYSGQAGVNRLRS